MTIGRVVPLHQLMRKAFSKLPESVFVEGNDYSINTDFRLWIELCDFMDSDASYEEKVLKLLCSAYTKELPPHLDTAVLALFEFMSLGKNGRGSGVEHCEKIMDFSEDEGLIYAAFKEKYNIDLYCDNLHWWKFINLLNALGEDTAFMKIVGYRSINCESIKNKELKRFYRKMKNKYKLFGNFNEDKIASAILDAM